MPISFGGGFLSPFGVDRHHSLNKVLAIALDIALPIGLAVILKPACALAGEFNPYPVSINLAPPPNETNERGFDIRKIAPPRPVDDDPTGGIVLPTSGTDFNTVSKDWMTKQASALTGGYDQKLVNRLNKSLNRGVESLIHSNTKPSDPSASPADAQKGDRAPASTTSSSESSNIGAMRFATINRLEMGITQSSQLSCLIKTDSIQWDYSHHLTNRMDFDLRHESRDSASTVRLHYNW